ncbi:MAG: 23S rRNA (guanosine(2251)-2'-O)-methyltransferase RlmB [Spirochaetaceae bacterium]|jgi:23S rRNA (guanosine2251-2'-O)-methyltransferase|nr:23S rRNA (guanosine(2251)-2'-O)-methyltransferase RlmB [Spirochaetaceae bacterium]
MTCLTGFHAMEEWIKAGRPAIALLVAKPGPRSRELVDLAQSRKIRIERVGTHELDVLARDHRGVALHIEDGEGGGEMTVELFLEKLGERKDALVLLLDEITDPHNYGAILRSADQFGVDLVISRNRRSAKHADVIAKTSSGAVSWVPQAETANLVRTAGQLKDAGFWIYGADMKGESAYKLDLGGRTALILGSEGTGLSRLIKEHCDGFAALPSLGRLDSLNVSVAAGALLYEVCRQRERA